MPKDRESDFAIRVPMTCVLALGAREYTKLQDVLICRWRYHGKIEVGYPRASVWSNGRYCQGVLSLEEILGMAQYNLLVFLA